jgi:hypothetical protein
MSTEVNVFGLGPDLARPLRSWAIGTLLKAILEHLAAQFLI